VLFEVLIFPVFLVFFARASRHFSLGAGEGRLPGRRGNGFVLLVFGRVFLESLIHRLSHGCLGFVSIVVGREVERAQSYIQTFVKSDHWLVLTLVDSLYRSNDSNTHICALLLGDRLLDGRMMLLVTGQNVGDQWALTGQKRTSYFERLGVPKLALLLDLRRVDHELLFRRNQKAQFRRHAEVANTQVADFLQNRVARQFHINTHSSVEVVDRQRRDLHDVADIQQEQPLRLVQIAQQHLHVELVLVAGDGRRDVGFPAAGAGALQLFLGDHTLGDLLDDRVDAVRGTLEHTNGVLVVDEVQLGGGLILAE